ncbi:hypothetical protein [Chondromyces crocatus]|uniref:Lipoprotein n=1 Tax=Chondromyces crocatus TaxID=52 RepID=A0A0K1EQC6_CHOCO|nr:hypothetical protein [Chondromyces crocatus]AKT43019.1 uncharacterized protein CMC5_072460 [Chondromyces crocatus]
MTRTLLTAVLASLLAVGCGRAALDAETNTPATAKAKPSKDGITKVSLKAERDSAETGSDRVEASENTAAVAPLRQSGDYVTYRFTGTFQKKPVTLTQRVVAREGDALLVDVSLTTGTRSETLRVKMSDAAENRGEILEVARIDAQGTQKAAPLSAYDALMARTTVAADVNEAELGSEAVNVDVGGQPIACNRTSYRVRIGGKTATMHTVQSERFTWGDVGGEITAEDGSVIYRAEVIDAGHTKPSGAPTAVAADDDYYDN